MKKIRIKTMKVNEAEEYYICDVCGAEIDDYSAIGVPDNMCEVNLSLILHVHSCRRCRDLMRNVFKEPVAEWVRRSRKASEAVAVQRPERLHANSMTNCQGEWFLGCQDRSWNWWRQQNGF